MPQENKALFVNKKGEPMSYKNLMDALKDVAIEAGLGKWEYKISDRGKRYKLYKGYDVSPLRFRRTHATWCLLNMKPAQAKRRMWGNESTGMDKIYSRITDKDAIEEYNRVAGGKPEQKTEDLVKQRTCFKCGQTYPVTVAICKDCNVPLDPALIEAAERKETEKLKAVFEMLWEQKQTSI